MRPVFLLCALAYACTPPPNDQALPGPGDGKTVTGDTPDTDTGTPDTDIDTDTDTDPPATNPGANECPGVIPAIAGTYTDTQFTTEEDFDFDGGGYLLSQSGGSIAALNRQGDVMIIPVPGFQDPSGLRVAANGDIVLAEPDTGSLRIVYRANGGTDILVSGMSNTNGVAADSLGYIAFSDFWYSGRVGLVDPVTFEVFEISPSLPNPNGLSFTQDGQRLFIVTSDGIMVSDRLSDTEFTAPYAHAPFPNGGTFWSIALDVCDRIYTLDFNMGEVWRAEPDGTGWVMIADIAQGGLFSSLRFGGGEGGWDRDVLYVTSRNHLFALPVGVNGIAPVAPVY